jgi:ferredoxin
MNEISTISSRDVNRLVDGLLAAGIPVIAPVRSSTGTRERMEYRHVANSSQMVLGDALPRRSLKEFFLPPTEPLLRWEESQEGISIHEVPTSFPRQVVLGSYPCDAAAVAAVDHVMNWEYKDELWNGRRESITVVSLACPGGDASCFCTLTGIAPDSAKGSDALLVPEGDGFRFEAVTSKGQALVSQFPDLFQTALADETRAYRETARSKVQGNLKADLPAVQRWLDAHFEHDFWQKVALNCHGCGACASLCPTCHCFDIVDEPDGLGTGVRRRNWDTCQTARFTVHGSGHNPRATQNSRMRQRIMHKFNIYPVRFGELLCTGCGRCARGCGGGMNLPEVLAELTRLADPPRNAGGAV